MYQALYRTWRPPSFDDVVGQEHITETLKRQVETGRLSHAYLFTGTRGTGKTSCAKILAKAINCEQPQAGNPCNRCPSCIGIDKGSILDVLELDAASNNGVDQVRALREEAIYTPAAVKMRVYIVDEVHMLSTAAFNALLKILEEPPSHLLFILATTELHKVPATIKSRCQQFSFKRILPEEIAARLHFIAKAEGFTLEDSAARLLSRLAEGGMRDALSLLDQCSGGATLVDEVRILQVLGLAGHLEIVKLLEQIATKNTAAALAQLAVLYREGKDLSALLGEISALVRDLLIRKTAPQGGDGLLTGGYEESVLRSFAEQLSVAELFRMLSTLQAAAAELYRSSNRRTDTELCIIRLCEPTLSQAPEALLARIGRLEELAQKGSAFAAVEAPPQSTQLAQQPTQIQSAAREQDPPPWDEPPRQAQAERPQPSTATNAAPAASKIAPMQTAQLIAAAPVAQGNAGGQDFKQFVTGLRGKLSPSAYTFLIKPAFVSGVFDDVALWLYVDTEMTKAILSKSEVQEVLTREVERYTGRVLQVHLRIGKPEEAAHTTSAAAVTSTQAAPAVAPAAEDKLNGLLQMGKQFGNITIK